MKKLIYTFLVAALAAMTLIQFTGCATSQAVKEKSGATLWAENCSRCHYSPDPEDYNDAQWEVIAMHMHIRTNLTVEETDKILEFLNASN